MASKNEKAKTVYEPAILLDRVLTTSKGPLHVIVDYRTYLNDIEDYKAKLIRIREFPFDLNAIPSSDKRIFEASQKFDYIEDENQVLAMVSKFYESMHNQCQTDASILAMTKKNPVFDFEPLPYPPPAKGEEWEEDADFAPFVPDLNMKLERRLKQVVDMISDSAETMQFFYSSMQTMFITAERKAREADADGFRSGRTRGNPDEKALPGSVQP